MLTYDVVVWSTRLRTGRPKPWELRWRVGEEGHSKSFALKPQADGRRSQLMEALRRGQQFDEETGLPEQELAALAMPTWFEHAMAYALMKWPGAAGKHRASIAESLAVVTPVYVRTTAVQPDPRTLRAALYQWAFRAAKTEGGDWVPRCETEVLPEDMRKALDWVAANSLKVSDAAKPEHIRSAFAALSKKLNGAPAAENTANRKRMVLSNAFRYAVEERALLNRHPFLAVDWTAPSTSDEVDFRYVPGPRLARRLLGAVAEQGPRGEHLETFFGAIYYVATRPGEAVSLRKDDFTLPPESEPGAWGEVLVSESHPEVGAGWTDGGKSHDERGLKHQARNAVRAVPIPPDLRPDGPGAHRPRRGPGRSSVLGGARRPGHVERVLRRLGCGARSRAHSPRAEVRDGRRALPPAPCRRISVDQTGRGPGGGAYRAGHSVAVLYRFYAKLLKGSSAHANSLIQKGPEEAEGP
ncbi:site-specific integrase [Streptomyces sp. NPDC050560]|uniref:site-specific integrase n=1 Tax=Streptomyces sp. NPDC050560 TaxID=3365630 RepID=UPI0037895AEA